MPFLLVFKATPMYSLASSLIWFLGTARFCVKCYSKGYMGFFKPLLTV